MNNASKYICIITMALLLIPTSLVTAADGEFCGKIVTGFRLVDVGGADRKYMEDYNLHSGPRLFDLQFEFVPEKDFRNAVDRVQVDLNNLGGDPFESLRIGIRKHGAYKFDYKRTKSTYFYNDIILPASQIEDVSKAELGDVHHFNFDRIRDVASLGIDINQNARATFGFERFTKVGESTTSLDIARDEFELDKPINESMKTYRGGIEYSLDKVTLAFEERVRDYQNMYEIFLPGFSAGEDTEDDAALTYFLLDQPYDFLSLEHTIRALARPTDRLDVRFMGLFQRLDMDVSAAETVLGVNYDSTALTTNETGIGEVNRDINLFDVDATYEISDRVSATGGFRYNKLDQNGDFTFAGDRNLGEWDIKTSGVDAGAVVLISPEVTAHGGVMYEKREVVFGNNEPGETLATEEETTKNTGIFAGTSWHPVKEFDFNFDLEINSFDDPFTLASPTDRKRYRLRGQYRWENGLTASGSFLFKDYENDVSGWMTDNKQVNLRLGYQQSKVTCSFGFGMVNSERDIDASVTGGSRIEVLNILYEADAKFIDGRACWKAHDRFKLGGSFRHYQNDGSFDLSRDDFLLWIEMTCAKGNLLRLGYHRVDYDETDFDWDDYDANIGELSFGRRW